MPDVRLEVRRVLVGLDGSIPGRNVLEAAAALAQVLEAELEGVFVEEEAWYRIVPRGAEGDVPLIGAYTGSVHTVERRRLGHGLRSLARRVEVHLEEISARSRLRSRFRVERGRPEAVMLGAAAEADLVTVGRVGRSHGRAGRLGTTARTLVEQSGTPVLLLPEGARLGGKVVVILDAEAEAKQEAGMGGSAEPGTPGAPVPPGAAAAPVAPGTLGAPAPSRTLALAAHLARMWEGGLEVILPRETAEANAARLASTRVDLAGLGIRDVTVRFATAGQRGHVEVRTPGTLVILERGTRETAAHRREATLEALRRVAVLLV